MKPSVLLNDSLTDLSYHVFLSSDRAYMRLTEKENETLPIDVSSLFQLQTQSLFLHVIRIECNRFAFIVTIHMYNFHCALQMHN